VLNSQTVSNFSQGTYLFWEVKGNARIRISKAGGGANAVLSGLFFDYPATSLVVGQPVISPDSGTFSAAATVTLVSPTPGATIRYTLDGTLPTSSSKLYEQPFVLAGSATVKARAFLDGNESSVATATFTVNVPWTGMAQAQFVGIDSATQGNWKSSYGAEGYHVVGDTASDPSYGRVSVAGHSAYTWTDSTSDVRAVQRAANPDRLASCWYGDQSFMIQVNLLDLDFHRLALYCLDWDTERRVQTIEILDANSGTVIDSRTLSSFHGGQYAVWDLRGSVKIRVTWNAGNNALVAGLFFGKAQTVSTQGPAVLKPASPTWSIQDGEFPLVISGEPGRRFRIDASSDLVNWTEISSVILTGPQFHFSDPRAAEFRSRFYRAVLVP
jgi:hypothetical protein